MFSNMRAGLRFADQRRSDPGDRGTILTAHSFSNPIENNQRTGDMKGACRCFYYGAHLLLAHLIEMGMNFARYRAKSFLLLAPPAMGSPSELFPVGFGFPLWTVYAVWAAVLLLLYPACLWFARLKQRRHDWWLTYL
ncbi:MAG TPA: hypothetical protein VI386_04640 [Candidatus Sulfotelmatobacter sp.]